MQSPVFNYFLLRWKNELLSNSDHFWVLDYFLIKLVNLYVERTIAKLLLSYAPQAVTLNNNISFNCCCAVVGANL